MDATTIERAKTGDEGVWPEAHEFRVEDRSGVRVFGTMSTPRANLAVADRGLRDHARRVTSAVSSSLSPFWAFERDKPWELGETFDAYASDGRWGKARVLGIWGKIVVAVFLPDSALWLPDDYLARLDTVMTFINNEGFQS